jgi:hypothetical protein
MRSFPHWVRLALAGVSIGHLFIEEAEAQTPAPAPPLRSPLQVLAAEGPNASHWALAPLQQPLPPDIRQNLTFLREDLIDEARTKPIGTPAAYNAAYHLCVGLIAALDERDLALVHAGFRSAQAINNQVLTSQALEARRNYMFSWPQYARTQDERALLGKQGTNNVNVAKEQLNVDWAARGAVLAKTFDTMYSQFREALRQTPALLVPMSNPAAGPNTPPPASAPPSNSPSGDSPPTDSPAASRADGQRQFRFRIHVAALEVLKVQGNSLWIESKSVSVPQKISINGKKWDPAWSAHVSNKYEFDPPLENLNDSTLKVKKVVGRGDITIIDHPTPANGEMLSIEFSDPQPDWGDYEVLVNW